MLFRKDRSRREAEAGCRVLSDLAEPLMADNQLESSEADTTARP